MTTIETALAVGQRIGGSPHLSQIIVRSDMKPADHLQIVVQHLIKICALCPGLCQNHGQMKTYGADIKSSHKHRNILLVCRIHPSPLIPGT